MKISMDQWKELLGQLEVVKTYYARLTERERYIVIGSAAAGLIAGMVLIYLSLVAIVASKASDIDKGRTYLKDLNDLKSEYSQSERQVQDLENMIRRTEPNFQLATELEKVARKHGVSIESIKDRPGPPNDLYQETQVSVSVKQVPLRTLIDLLFEIENSKQLLRITSLQIKPNFQDPTQLNVNFVVSTFQSAGGV
jgi:type II secretory pathway component PulM